ncbi:hypothetical protein [Devosia ginsengisoli]|uniref:hypothetical protein n=1 Tax=Devosia ginsengisoli TaxID=400770 RepID=UPI0026E9767C|nr:hypothetical protein [Devosia ginsengisoli]MCR6672220.1 hypothetical protein [Devosia ginsengisoli]
MSGKKFSAQPAATLEVRCERCSRHGRYACFRLYAEFGDLGGRDALIAIAAKGGCHRARQPPAPADGDYLEKRCQIAPVSDADSYMPPPTIYSRMHQGWRLFVKCDRQRQGLKSAKPCPVPPVELDLPTLVATLGHDYLVDDLWERLVAPCCATRSIKAYWYEPEAKNTPQNMPQNVPRSGADGPKS